MGGGLTRTIIISLFATLACVGIIKAATTVGNNISTTGTITGSGANTLYGATSIGGALTATSTLSVSGLTTLGNASTTLLSVSGTGYIGGDNGLILSDGSILDASGAISFGNENLTTTGTLNISGLTTLGNASTSLLTVSGNSYLATTTISSTLAVSGTIQGNLNGRNYMDEFSAKLGNLAGLGTGAVTILSLGDSWQSFSFSPNAKLRSFLQNKYGNGGGGYISPLAAGMARPTGYTAVQSGSWTDSTVNSNTKGCIGGSTSSSSNLTDSITFSGFATDIYIHYVAKSGGGKFTWSIDGGAATEIDTVAGATTVEEYTHANLTGLSDTSHTLVLTVSGAGSVEIVGAEFNRSQGGVRLHNAARSSQRMDNYADQNATEWREQVAHFSPSLVMISGGLNERAANSKAVFKADIQTIINNVKAAVPLASILLFSEGDGSTLDMSSYADALAELALENNVGYLDTRALIGSYAEATGRTPSMYTDTLHLTAGGYAVMSDAIIDYLKPHDLPGYASANSNWTLGDSNQLYISKTNSVRNISIGYGQLNSLTTGDGNIGIGYLALEDVTTATYNIGIGDSTLSNATTGGGNVAIGYSAMNLNTDGGSNVAIGNGAMDATASASGNVAIGYNTMTNMTGSGLNTAVGSSAMQSITTGGWATAVGYQALFSASTNYRGTAFGLQAGYSSTGADGLFLGSRAGYYLTSGARNVIIGRDTCYQTNTESAGKCGGVSNTASDVFAVDSNNVDSPLLFGSFADGSEYLTINGKQTNAPQTTTLSSTALALTRNVVYLTCSSNALTTITGGITGQIITIKFADACTVTNNDAAGANTIDMSTFLTFAAKDTLQLLFDGTSWYEVGHSDNT